LNSNRKKVGVAKEVIIDYGNKQLIVVFLELSSTHQNNYLNPQNCFPA
jgi:hypothetical protein